MRPVGTHFLASQVQFLILALYKLIHLLTYLLTVLLYQLALRKRPGSSDGHSLLPFSWAEPIERLTLKNVHLERSKSVISENVCRSRDRVDCGHVLRDVTAVERLIIRE